MLESLITIWLWRSFRFWEWSKWGGRIILTFHEYVQVDLLFHVFLGIVMYANEVETKDQVTWNNRIDYTAYKCTSRLIVHTVPHVDKLWN